MGVQFVIDTPDKIRFFDPEAPALDASSAQQVAEIFQTPLTGAYNWDYKVQDDRIKKLYELGKQLYAQAGLRMAAWHTDDQGRYAVSVATPS